MGEAQGPNETNGGYGKRPLWQWVLLYIIIGGIVYFAVYYFYMRTNPNPYGKTTTTPQSQTQGQSTSTGKNTSPAVNNSVLMAKTDPSLGQYLADPSGKALYTNGSDTNSCTDSCLSVWPVYVDSGSSTNLPTDVTVVNRTDNGQMQFAYKGKPLYYFASDNGNQVTGNGVSGFQVARP